MHRLEGLWLDLALKRRRGDRPDELEDQLAVALDDERLGHAIDAPVDAGAVILVETHPGVRVAFDAEEAANVLGRVLLRDAIDGDALGLELGIGRERHKILMLEMTRLAPGAEDIDQADMAAA